MDASWTAKNELLQDVEYSEFNLLTGMFPIAKYDIIFCDPPYELLGIEEIPNLVFEKNLLTQEGLLIVEHGRDTRFEEHPQFNELKKYSSVNFSFFEEG